MENWRLKKFFLYLLVCSIALSALMGIWAIISGEFGELQSRILATTTTVVGMSILGLACGAYLESPRSHRMPAVAVPVLGIVLTVVSALVIFWLIWASDSWGGENTFKILSTSLIFAFSFAQLSLLSLARLSARFRWALTAAYAVALLLASIISAIIITEARGDDGLVFRLIGVLAVADAALTVMIPIFHRLSRAEFSIAAPPTISAVEAEIADLKSRLARLEMQRDDILNAQAKN